MIFTDHAISGPLDLIHESEAICYLLCETKGNIRWIKIRSKEKGGFGFRHFDWTKTLEGHDYWSAYPAGRRPDTETFLSETMFQVNSKTGQLEQTIMLDPTLRIIQGLFIRNIFAS